MNEPEASVIARQVVTAMVGDDPATAANLLRETQAPRRVAMWVALFAATGRGESWERYCLERSLDENSVAMQLDVEVDSSMAALLGDLP